MDGNGRWARQRHLPRYAGHRSGVKATRRAVEACVERQIANLTLFAFSSENWRRPKKEVGVLMDLFVSSLESEVDELHRAAVRIEFIGDRSAFGSKLAAQIDAAEKLTQQNDGMRLFIAANYGGRWDIAQAAKQLAARVERGELSSAEITEADIDTHTALAGVPAPDLFIRTGGEQRLSNFLIWQLAYCELYFTDQLWPDFDGNALDSALDWFRTRERRYGKTSEQVESA